MPISASDAYRGLIDFAQHIHGEVHAVSCSLEEQFVTRNCRVHALGSHRDAKLVDEAATSC